MLVFQIKVTLCDIDPPIWRRFQVESDIRLDQLHELLQIVMGWDNDHAHGFRFGDRRYGVPSRSNGRTDERKVDLALIAGVGDTLIYEYDFGDGWEHKLDIEEILELEPGVRYPVCVGGERACPPEDCGGFIGYDDLIDALLDPENAEHAGLLERRGNFDPEAFDSAAVNARLADRVFARIPRSPVYSDEELARLEPAALLELMIREASLVPRNVIDACVRHGDAMVECLSGVPADERYWRDDEDFGEWFLPLHAAMILGLMPSARAGLLLLEFMPRLARATEESPGEVLDDYWPALFSNKPDDVLPGLRALSTDRTLDWLIRGQAIASIVLLAQSGQTLEKTLDWAEAIVADETEDWDTRLLVATSLLGFPRDRYRPLLNDLAAKQTGNDVMFTSAEVRNAYATKQDNPEWDELRDPWEFYSPAQIEARRQIWERADFGLEDGDDKWDDSNSTADDQPYVRAAPKVGRNDPCPCGSGKKYKKCCLLLEQA